MDDRSRWRDAPLDDLDGGSGSGGAGTIHHDLDGGSSSGGEGTIHHDLDGGSGSGDEGTIHHDLCWWSDMSTDWDFHDLANLLGDGNGLRDSMHASEALDRAELVVDRLTARLRAHDGAEVAVHGRAGVIARDRAERRLRLKEPPRGREVPLPVAAQRLLLPRRKNPGRLRRAIEQLQPKDTGKTLSKLHKTAQLPPNLPRAVNLTFSPLE
jgi:hypothetical protein